MALGLLADIRETHSAVVVMLGDRAYKLKKAVNLGFLDFRTREARAEACRRELLLNRRFAPDVYLGTADVVGHDALPCEHLLVMRRMPDDRRLSTLVAQGADVGDDVRRLARQLAAFHAKAPTDEQISEQGKATALLGRWGENLADVRSHGIVGADVVAETEHLAVQYVLGREPLLEDRARKGWIKDGHGDLLAEDVFCLPDGPRVLDCLDFDDRLRWIDVLDDVGCLAMDLERLGAPPLAAAFMQWYEEFSGVQQSVSLEHHYIAYRAFMRAKVTGVRARQGVHAAIAEARALADLSMRHLRAAQVRLVLVGGAPGAGKSTLAEALADRMGATLLRSDRVRKELAGIDPSSHVPAPFEQGIYDRATTVRTYDEILRRAGRAIVMGESVVVDASFASADHRLAADEEARRTRADLVTLRCVAPTEVLRSRLRLRHRETATWSDADDQVGLRVAAEFDPWPTAFAVDTSRTPDTALEQASAVLRIEPEAEWPRRSLLAPD